MDLNMRDWFLGRDMAKSDPDDPGLYEEEGCLTDEGHRHKGVIPFDPDPNGEKIIYGVPFPSHIRERKLRSNLPSF